MTTVAIHQPDLLPYSGFWYKMIHSDVFVLAVHDQFQKHGYQRRVTMRGRWASHILEGKPALIPIEDVVVREGWQRHLTNVIRGRYSAARYFKTRGRELCERIEAAQGRSLDEVNTAMIEIVRDMLGITTPLVTTPPPRATTWPASLSRSPWSTATSTSPAPAAWPTWARTPPRCSVSTVSS